jgi:hypothetical protein
MSLRIFNQRVIDFQPPGMEELKQTRLMTLDEAQVEAAEVAVHRS